MEILEKIFGSAAKVKMMRLFLFNPEIVFGLKEIAERTKVNKGDVKKEMSNLEKMGLVKRRVFFFDKKTKRGKKEFIKKIRTEGWILDNSFAYLVQLQNFLIKMNPLKPQNIISRLSRAGKLKLVIISGVFIQEWDSRVDIMVVGDGLKKGTLENAVKGIEAELGKELKYSYFDTGDFLYRMGVCDKLIRDVLDFPHEKILNRLSLT